MKNTSSYGIIPDDQPVVAAPATKPLDADAERALAWIRRGKPRPKVAHDDDLAVQTRDELKLFGPASYVRVPSKPR